MSLYSVSVSRGIFLLQPRNSPQPFEQLLSKASPLLWCCNSSLLLQPHDDGVISLDETKLILIVPKFLTSSRNESEVVPLVWLAVVLKLSAQPSSLLSLRACLHLLPSSVRGNLAIL